MDGRVLQRHVEEASYEAGDPSQLHYYFGGVRIGDVSNDGTSNVDYAGSITEHTRNQGGTTAPSWADAPTRRNGHETGSVVFLSGARTDEGVQKGFGVETRNQDERDILSNGLARRSDSDKINAAILAYRMRTTGAAGGGTISRPPTFKLGESDGGPGKWAPAPAWVKLTEEQAAYQKHATGAPRGREYVVKTSAMPSGEKYFDGYDLDTGNLIEARRWEGWPIDADFSQRSATASLRELSAIGVDLNRTAEVRVSSLFATQTLIEIANANEFSNLKIRWFPEGE